MRHGDTLVVAKLDRFPRSVPDARAIAYQLSAEAVRLALGQTVYDPGDPMRKMFFNILDLSPLPPDRYLSLRREDVLRCPRDKLRELATFIDPSLVSHDWLGAALCIPCPNPLKFGLLDPETQRRLTDACTPGLEALGYET